MKEIKYNPLILKSIFSIHLAFLWETGQAHIKQSTGNNKVFEGKHNFFRDTQTFNGKKQVFYGKKTNGKK